MGYKQAKLYLHMLLQNRLIPNFTIKLYISSLVSVNSMYIYYNYKAGCQFYLNHTNGLFDKKILLVSSMLFCILHDMTFLLVEQVYLLQ